MSENKVIVISAHPDDETLGCGGTLLRHKSGGDKLFWIIVTNVSIKHGGYTQEFIEKRQEEINSVYLKLKFNELFKLDYPTMNLTSHDLLDLIPKISEIFNIVKPNIIYVNNRSDTHSDHRIVFDAVAACTKSFRYPFIKKFLMYETLSETEFAPALLEKTFIPNYFVDISDFIDEKIELMKIYSSELGEHPFPRSIKNIKALATYRGSFAGVEYAEAFQILHIIDK